MARNVGPALPRQRHRPRRRVHARGRAPAAALARLISFAGIVVLVALTFLAPSPALADEEADPARAQEGADLASRLVAGPVVIHARVVRVSVKATLEVLEVLRGNDVPKTIRLAFRGANLERPLDTPPFDPIEGEEAIFVLRPWVDSEDEQPAPDLFMPAEGFGSRIPIPIEGRDALLQAVLAIVSFQDRPDHEESLAELLSWAKGRNPLLVDVALDQAARFAYADREWVPTLLSRARDVAPNRRVAVAEALGVSLARGRFEPEPRFDSTAGVETDEPLREARETLIRLARTDPSVAVRRAAVRWLGRSSVPGIKDILAAIGADDPSQEVRFDAAAALMRLADRERRERETPR